MKIAEISTDEIKNYMGIYDDSDDTLISQIFKPAAIKHITDYTGLIESEVLDNDNMAITFLILISYLYDNRSVSVQNDKINIIFKNNLNMYRQNLL